MYIQYYIYFERTLYFKPIYSYYYTLLSHSYISAKWTQLKLTLEQATKAHRGIRGIAVLFL